MCVRELCVSQCVPCECVCGGVYYLQMLPPAAALISTLLAAERPINTTDATNTGRISEDADEKDEKPADNTHQCRRSNDRFIGHKEAWSQRNLYYAGRGDN